MKKFLLATTIISSLIAPAIADENHALVMGFGTSSCGEFIKDIQDKNSGETMLFLYITWVQGAMSAANILSYSAGNDTTDLNAWDLKSQEKYLINYCQDHPADSINVAGSHLYDQLPTVPTKKKGS